MIRRVPCVCAAIVLIFGSWPVLAEGAPPTAEDLRALKIIGPLSASARHAVEKYIVNWAEKLKSAGKLEEIVRARKALTDGYGAHSSTYWLVKYAELSAKHLIGALSLDDQVRQIQASMALAAMPQYTIQPALEAMARHGNPAVRYWAARGYRSATKRMLLYDERAATMLATLKTMGMKESGPILTVVFQTLSRYLGESPDIPAKLHPVLEAIWSARRKDLLAGKADVIEAYRKAVEILEPLGQNDKGRVLQLLADALESASVGFARLQDQKDPAAGVFMDLLGDLETRLAALTSTGKTPIGDILSNEEINMEQKAAEVRLKAVNGYWTPLLAGLGIKPRDVELTTKPAIATHVPG